MAEQIYSQYPPTIPEELCSQTAAYVKDWTAEHGLLVRPSAKQVTADTNPNNVLATNAPVSLFPSPFPRKLFEQAQSLQTVYNELYAAIASDEAFLEAIMREYVGAFPDR
jgi:glutathione synthase